MDSTLTSRQISTYTVQIPIYEGPLDLLLQLIEHAELDIVAVSLAQVTEQYLMHIRSMAVPPDEISAFLVVAAKLLQIKSEALLPRPPIREPGEEDPGESLARQLLIYKRFKEMAIWLEKRTKNNLRTYLRVAPPPKVEAKLDLSNISLADLLAAAEAAFSQEQDKQSLGTVITAPKVTIREKLALIAEKLGHAPHSTFGELIGQHPSRLEVVVTFLALLELVKRYRVAAKQEALFGEIEIDRSDDWDQDEELELEFE
jgi:segregation and condensation protein A